MLKKLKLNFSMKTYKTSRTNTEKRCPFHHGGLRNAKIGSQEIPGVTGKFGLGVQSEAGQRLTVCPRERTGHSKYPLPNNIKDDSIHWHHQWSITKSNWLYSLQPNMEKLYTVNKNKTGSWCGSDHELLIAKFRLKLKKVGKTTRPKSNPLQCKWQIDYSRECLKNYGWGFVTLYRRQ